MLAGYDLAATCVPGLSDQSEIESYFVIKSNVYAEIKPNRMHIESNDFFNFWYDSIWKKMWARKLWTVTVKINIISKDGMSNEIFQNFCHPGGQSLWNMPIHWWPIKFNDCWGGFVSNRIVFWIELISNRKVSATSWSKIESKPIRFDSPGVFV